MCSYKIIIFDVDSTLVKIEGLDWLAKQKGLGKEICKITRDAMEGKIAMREALHARMKLVSPSRKDFLDLGKAYCHNLVCGAKQVVISLRKLGVDIWIVSGGFSPAVEILAQKLGISKDHVICNKVFFDNNGKYAGFDEKHVLVKNHGKSIVAKKLKFQFKREIILVGDGYTDLEAKNVVDLFVAFGGVVRREKVIRAAGVVILKPDLRPLLKIV